MRAWWCVVLASCNTPAPAHESTIDAGAIVDVASEPIVDAHAEEETSVLPEGMLLVPGGRFFMGANRGGEEDERPAHEVTVESFYLDRTEVTNEAYAECVAAKVCAPKQPNDFQRPKQPVSSVCWDDAKKYCAWKGKRLPREAEFERAVRGDDGRKYPWGNDPITPERSVYQTGAPEDVGSRPSGKGPYGHDDLAGNVWEWIEDEYDPYAYRRPEGKPGTCMQIMITLGELRDAGKQGFTGLNPIPNECEHVIRGGAYNYAGTWIRSTDRVHHPGRFHIPMLGFRCAL